MPRGQPDYGIYTETPVASGISDPGEAAARLGSINVYDRRGWTVWMDDFESPSLKWPATSSVGSPDPLLSTVEQWMGEQSVYFATVAGAGEHSTMEKLFPLVRLGRVGIEFFVRLECRTPGYLQCILHIFDGVNISTATLRLDNQARTASIITPAGTIVIATNCFPTIPNKVWIPVKLVVDMDTDLYNRLLIGEREYDISAHALVPGAVTTNRFLDVSIRLIGDAIAVMYAYLDNFILTQNEP